MRATFSFALDFSSIDLSIWSSRTSAPVLSTGSFSFGGTTYENRYVLLYAAGGDPFALSLLGDDLASAHGVLTGGTVGVIRQFGGPSGNQVLFAVDDIALSAATLHAALRSASPTDDRAIFDQLLAGADQITLSGGADRAYVSHPA